MRVAVIAMSFLLIAASPAPAVLSVKLLVGEWRADEVRTYHFYANHTWSSHFADEGEGGQWRLQGLQLELIFEDAREKPGQRRRRETISIERIVHETLYVRHDGVREVWLKQPGV